MTDAFDDETGGEVGEVDGALAGWLADPNVWVEPPATLEVRVLAAVAAERDDQGRGAAGTEAATGTRLDPTWVPDDHSRRIVDESSTKEPRRRGAAWRSPGGRSLVALGAAAAVLVAIVLASSALRDRPPAFEASLAGTDLAKDASGRVIATRTDSGWRLRLDVRGLPRLDGGRFYQAWMKQGAEGPLVPVGTFNEGRDVTLWAGVSPADFALFTVTAEVADGDQSSSGQRVLAGTLTKRS